MYQKPEIKCFDSLFEGVYALSGDGEILDNFVAGGNEHIPSAEPQNERADYELVQTNAWDGNKQYEIKFYNNSSEPTNLFSVTLTVRGVVNTIAGNVKGVISGNTAEISFDNYGNKVEPGGSTQPIFMWVIGNGDFSVE